MEVKRSTVNTISQSSWSWTVIKDVTKVGVTAAAQHLRSAHHQRPVRLPPDVVRLVLRPVSLEEGRPAGAGVKLVFAGEERDVAADTVIHPWQISRLFHVQQGNKDPLMLPSALPLSWLSLNLPVHARSVACLLVTWYWTLLNTDLHSSSLSLSGVSRDFLTRSSSHELPGGGSLWF